MGDREHAKSFSLEICQVKKGCRISAPLLSLESLALDSAREALDELLLEYKI